MFLENGASAGVSDWYQIDPTLSFHQASTAALHKAWLDLCPEGQIPHRRDFDPTQHVALLPDLFMIEITPDTPPRYRYRLLGTRIVETLGRDVTGAWLDEIYGQKSDIFRSFQEQVRKRQPARTYGTVNWLDKSYLAFESGLFPLRTDDQAVGRLVGATVYTPVRSLLTPSPVQSPSS